MSLIDIIDIIDDRDTTYIIEPENGQQIVQTVQNKFKEWQTAIKNVLPVDAVVNHLGNGRYRIALDAITCTGSDVEQIINIPYMHQLLKMQLKHTDSSKADSNDALTYSLYQKYLAGTWGIITAIVATTAADMSDEFIDDYRMRGEYKLITNSTNTDQIYVVIYIRITGE